MPSARHAGVGGLLLASVTASAALIDDGFAQPAPKVPASKPPGPAMTTPKIDFEPLPFSAIPGWNTDDHAAAFASFLKSCARLNAIAASRAKAAADPAAPPPPNADLLAICSAALALEKQSAGRITRST